MAQYANACGWALARAHARSGDPAQIAGYLGSNNRFEESLADFAVLYADQNDRDHAAFVEAVSAGRVEVYMER
jgi:NAD(P)H-dependent flavin oxidoreductase YrpB (nitropropane dioxygenase family)